MEQEKVMKVSTKESQQGMGTVAGKKRKKKKKKKQEKEVVMKEEEKRGVPTNTAGTGSQKGNPITKPYTVPPGSTSRGMGPKPSTVFADCSDMRPTEDRCYSSSSSVENSKPSRKIGRFDCCSSDAMSIDQTSSSAAMEVSSASQNGSPFPSSMLLPGSTTVVKHPNIPPNCSNLSVTTNTSSLSYGTHTPQSSVEQSSGYISNDPSVSSMESLRWEQQYSDEEKEKERIEVYKANRRKRYENSLKEKRSQLDQTKQPYYTPSMEEESAEPIS